MDEPTVCHTGWKKSEREKNISYINAYIWKLEKWNWWTYLQGRNRDTDIENTVGEGEGGMNWESSTETYTLPYVKQIASGKLQYNTGALWQLRGMEWGRRWERSSRGKRTYVYLWLIHVDIWQKPTQHCKAIILQLKKKNHCIIHPQL